jgi:hypothetical protein
VILNGNALDEHRELRRYKIVNDIYLNDPTKIDWTSGDLLDPNYSIRTWYSYTESSFTPFRGIIEGNNHTIYGLYLNTPDSNIGLLPLIDGNSPTTIRNLGIDCSYLKGSSVTAFVGNMKTVESRDLWKYEQNRSIVNFGDKRAKTELSLNNKSFTPIGKLQLLEFNTGESYPFADRLVEYLSGSAITAIDEIPDNIIRAQRVMELNQHYFKIEGLWENKIQKIIYDYLMNSSSNASTNKSLNQDPTKYYRELGFTSKSTLYDTLGYIDRDAEKWYANWKKQDNRLIMRDNIQNVDIYKSLWDI